MLIRHPHSHSGYKTHTYALNIAWEVRSYVVSVVYSFRNSKIACWSNDLKRLQGGQEIHIQYNINNEHYNCTKLTVIIHDTEFTIDHCFLTLFSLDYSFYTIRLNLKHLMHNDNVRFISMHVSFSGLKEDMVKINNYNFPDWVIYIEWDLTIDFFYIQGIKILITRTSF